MLEFLRRGVQSWYFKGLFGLLVISFAIFGIGDIFRNTSPRDAAITVGDKEISGREVFDALRRRMNTLSRRLGTDISIEQARQFGIVDQTVSALVNDALYDAEAKDLGVVASDAAVTARIKAERNFRGATGGFDRAVFEQTLASNGLSEQQFVNQLRRAIIREQILGGIAPSVSPSSRLVEQLFRWREESRIAELIAIKIDPSSTVDAPDDSKLQAFYKENQADFVAPEYRKILYVAITPEAVADEIAVPEEALREAYKDRIDEFSAPAQRILQQIVLPDEKTAKLAEKQLAEGRDFLAVAKELANQDATATNLGDMAEADLPAELSGPVFKLGKGETSPPLKGPFGWHIFRVNDVKPARTRSFEEVRKVLRDEIARDKTADALVEMANALEDALGGGATLEEAASQLNIPLGQIDAINRQGRGSDGKPVVSKPADPRFLQVAFDTPEGEESPLIETDQGGYLILRVDGVTPSTTRPFEAVRDEVLRKWQAMRRRELVEEKANDALKRLKDGQQFADIAKEFGLTVKTSAPFTRQGRGADADLPRTLVSDLFTVKTGQPAIGETSGGYTVAVLKEVRQADATTESGKKKLAALGDALRGQITSDIIVQYNNALRQRHDVSINQRVIDALVTQN